MSFSNTVGRAPIPCGLESKPFLQLASLVIKNPTTERIIHQNEKNYSSNNVSPKCLENWTEKWQKPLINQFNETYSIILTQSNLRK